ncbi:MAG TPA: carboxypeptidase-like regulatory domain-containing protein [Sphingobacteriaceae bacterium]|nr:carboxypeptidase-like regulatory domain-containing protein [Sphingobacteriaceae bacterium]
MKIALRVITILILVSALKGTKFGQSSISLITGQIVDETEKQLPAATVSLVDINNKEIFKIYTDVTGRFSISRSLKGDYRLVARYTGYKEYRSEIFTLADKNFGIIKMTPVSQTLGEIVITGTKDVITMEGMPSFTMYQKALMLKALVHSRC